MTSTAPAHDTDVETPAEPVAVVPPQRRRGDAYRVYAEVYALRLEARTTG